MIKKFNLSETEWYDGAMYLYNRDDVKEFIKRLKEEFSDDTISRIINLKIDKLAGDNLI